MNERMLQDLLKRIRALERAQPRVRIGEVTDLAPLDVALGGSDTSYEDVVSVGPVDVGDQVAALVAGNDLLVLGRILAGAGIRFGSAAVTFPGGSQNSSTLAVSHELGRTPIIALATPAGTGGPEYVVVTQVVSDTVFNVVMRNTVSSPAAATQRTFYWLAL